VVLDDPHADRHRLVLAAQRIDEDEVPATLRHLVSVHPHHRHVHPMAHERHTRGCFRLGALAFVVREDEVGTAAVQIDRRAELAQRESGTLDVPARSTRTPQRVPRGLVARRRLPQDEVERVALVRVVDIAAAFAREGDHRVAVEPRQRAELLAARHVEVHRSAGAVRISAVEHHADESADVGNRRRCARTRIHLECVECGKVVVEARLLAEREIEPVNAELAGLREERIVDVGDVAHALHPPTRVDEPAHEHVVREEREGVTEVRRVVRRHAARVHEHLVAGGEVDDLAARGVVEPHAHFSGMPVNRGATRVL